jgi:purine-binding chemotaxis protein CheW
MNQEVNEQSVVGLGTDANANQFLTFMLAGEEYGVDILRVQEIKGWENATEIPNTPDYIEGVMNLRGTIVPIVDLRSRFALERIDYSNTTVVIVLKIISGESEKTIGFVVDAVSDVYNLTDEQLKASPDFGNSVSTEFVSGLATVDEKMLILLDIDHLIDADIDVTQVVAATETKKIPSNALNS